MKTILALLLTAAFALAEENINVTVYDGDRLQSTKTKDIKDYVMRKAIEGSLEKRVEVVEVEKQPAPRGFNSAVLFEEYWALNRLVLVMSEKLAADDAELQAEIKKTLDASLERIRQAKNNSHQINNPTATDVANPERGNLAWRIEVRQITVQQRHRPQVESISPLDVRLRLVLQAT